MASKSNSREIQEQFGILKTFSHIHYSLLKRSRVVIGETSTFLFQGETQIFGGDFVLTSNRGLSKLILEILNFFNDNHIKHTD
jgi:hypothetical protein